MKTQTPESYILKKTEVGSFCRERREFEKGWWIMNNCGDIKCLSGFQVWTSPGKVATKCQSGVEGEVSWVHARNKAVIIVRALGKERAKKNWDFWKHLYPSLGWALSSKSNRKPSMSVCNWSGILNKLQLSCLKCGYNKNVFSIVIAAPTWWATPINRIFKIFPMTMNRACFRVWECLNTEIFSLIAMQAVENKMSLNLQTYLNA